MNIVQLWHDEPDGVVFVAVLLGFALIIIFLKILGQMQIAGFRSYLEERGWELQPITKKFTIFGRHLSDETKELVSQIGVFDASRLPIILAKKTFKGHAMVTQVNSTPASGDIGKEVYDQYTFILRLNVPEEMKESLPSTIASLQSAGYAFSTVEDNSLIVHIKEFYLPKSIQPYHEKVSLVLEKILK